MPEKKPSSRKMLNLEITEQVKGVDAFMTKIIKDRSVWKQFFNNPASVLAEVGFTKPLSKDTEWKYNKIFYALLTDKKLLEFVHDGDFEPRMDASQVDKYFESLKSGKFEYDPEVDVDIVNRSMDNSGSFRILMKMSLNRINEEGIFSEKYDSKKIDECVDQLMKGVDGNQSLMEMSKTVPWHAEMGEELNHVMVAVPPALALPVVVEAVACGTLACVVVPLSEEGLATESVENLQAKALSGDKDNIKALSLLGMLLEFISELADHVNDFERIVRD